MLDDVWPLGKFSGDLTTTPLVVGDDVVEVALTPATSSYGAWALPWVQFGSLLVLVGAVLAVLRVRRRREARTQARIDAAVAARTGAAVPGADRTGRPRRPVPWADRRGAGERGYDRGVPPMTNAAPAPTTDVSGGGTSPLRVVIAPTRSRDRRPLSRSPSTSRTGPGGGP
ncbi:hypothetical protein NKG05_20360 [Oerskovia sp. M15]